MTDHVYVDNCAMGSTNRSLVGSLLIVATPQNTFCRHDMSTWSDMIIVMSQDDRHTIHVMSTSASSSDMTCLGGQVLIQQRPDK